MLGTSKLKAALSIVFLVEKAIGTLVAAGHGDQGSIEAQAGPQADASLTRLFEEFMSKHKRNYKFGSQEYQDRRSIFERRLRMVQRHNQKARKLWKAGINKFADMSDVELESLRGYKRSVRSGSYAAPGGPAPVGLMGAASSDHVSARMPQDFTWQGKLQATTNVLDQGRCGSCWAFASVTTLNAHSELFADGREFSPQQLVSCAPNPRKCGGSGGCEGATVELAFDYLLQATAVTEEEFNYVAADVPCPPHLTINGTLARNGVHGADAPSVEDVNLALRSPGKPTFGLIGWTALPENKARPFFQTLYESGPIAVALAAYSRWTYYESGILDSCGDEDLSLMSDLDGEIATSMLDDSQGFIVNHAVVLVGWGVGGDQNQPYWQIQNSWGVDWGENGYMRILRRDGVHSEEQFCAMDDDPLVGVGCPDGPSTVKVCGSCGMLYDGLVPTFEGSRDSWWAKSGHQVYSQTSLRGA